MEKFNGLGKKIKDLGIATLVTFGALASKGAETKNINLDKELHRNTSVKDSSNEKNSGDTTNKNKIAVYTNSKTKEGGTTPTGFSNSFLENEYEIKPEDLDSVAKAYGFRNDNAKNFQEDMILYAVKNKPEIIDSVLEKFGSTAYGEENNITDYKQLLDGKLGRRDAFILGNLKKDILENNRRSSNQESISKTDPEIKKEDKIFNLEGIDKLYIFYDVSPSTQVTREILRKDLIKNEVSLPIKIIGFTDKIEFTQETTNIQEASGILKNAKFSEETTELAVTNLVKEMEKMENEGTKLIISATDEELQNVTKEDLMRIKELSKEKNAQVQFTIVLENKIHNISIDDLLEIYTKKYAKAVEDKIKNYSNLINLREKYINTYKQEIEKTSERKKLKELKELLRNEEKELLDLKTTLIRERQVNINNFTFLKNDLAKR